MKQRVRPTLCPFRDAFDLGFEGVESASQEVDLIGVRREILLVAWLRSVGLRSSTTLSHHQRHQSAHSFRQGGHADHNASCFRVRPQIKAEDGIATHELRNLLRSRLFSARLFEGERRRRRRRGVILTQCGSKPENELSLSNIPPNWVWSLLQTVLISPEIPLGTTISLSKGTFQDPKEGYVRCEM